MHQLEVMKVLQALTVTRYQLRLEELVGMLAVHFDLVHSRFVSDVDPLIFSIVSMCSFLVTSSAGMRSDEIDTDEVVKLLLGKGASPNLPSVGKESPLF